MTHILLLWETIECVAYSWIIPFNVKSVKTPPMTKMTLCQMMNDRCVCVIGNAPTNTRRGMSAHKSNMLCCKMYTWLSDCMTTVTQSLIEDRTQIQRRINGHKRRYKLTHVCMDKETCTCEVRTQPGCQPLSALSNDSNRHRNRLSRSPNSSPEMTRCLVSV